MDMQIAPSVDTDVATSCTPANNQCAGHTGGSTLGAQNSTPELQRTPSYMLATNSSKSKVFSTPPANRSRNEVRCQDVLQQ
jgi:hypothetical protein